MDLVDKSKRNAIAALVVAGVAGTVAFQALKAPGPETAPPRPAPRLAEARPDADAGDIVGTVECSVRRTQTSNQDPATKLCNARAGDATVASGSHGCAQEYYAKVFKALGLPHATDLDHTSLDELLAFLGLPGLHLVDLEQRSAPQLMATAAPANTLAGVAIFAPKIADVSGIALPKYGWRKLIRIFPPAGSPAATNTIQKAYILFNYLQEDPKTSPFLGQSINTQVILMRTPAALKPGDDIAYWLDYGPSKRGALLSYSLPATFDGRFPRRDASGAPAAIKEYFVPDACVACHGESVSRPLLNYFDTDHIEDRLDKGNDFEAVSVAGGRMFPDEGVPGGCTHEECFAVVRKLNEEMAAENLFAQPCHIELQAAQKWLSLHKTSDAHVPLTQRALDVTMSPTDKPIRATHTWSATGDDPELLGLLNRYCFRCHGSVRFNVFDKDAVLFRRKDIEMRITGTGVGTAMPTDRELPAAHRDRLVTLIKAIGR